MAPNSRSDYVYIDTNEALARFCEDLAVASYCVIDTEFIRESTYYPQLALIQIACGDHLACIELADPDVTVAVESVVPLTVVVDPAAEYVVHQVARVIEHEDGAFPGPDVDRTERFVVGERRGDARCCEQGCVGDHDL